jgi:hypothetical protein
LDLRPLVGAALLALFIAVFAAAFVLLPARPRADRVADDPAWSEDARRPAPAAQPPRDDADHVPTRRSRYDTGVADDEPTQEYI